MEFWFEVAAKIATYAAMLLLIGGLGLRWLLLPLVEARAQLAQLPGAPPRPASAAGIVADAAAAADRLVLRCAVILIVALLLRVLAHTIAAFGLTDAWTFENLRLIALESQWGLQWQQQAMAAVAVAIAALVGLTQPAGRYATIAAAVVLCFLLPRLGHAAGETDRVLVHGFHIIAGGLWVGTLAAVVTSTSPSVQQLRPSLLNAFAPVAMTCVAMLVASGAFAVWTYLGPVSNLWTTPYGRLLAVKLFMVFDALTLGGLNWRRMHRRNRPPEKAFAIAETILAAAIVIVTGWLTETGHP